MKIENIFLNGFYPAIRGMRNPYNSWDKSDTLFVERRPMTVSELRVIDPANLHSTAFSENVKRDWINDSDKNEILTKYFSDSNKELKIFNPIFEKNPFFERPCYVLRFYEEDEKAKSLGIKLSTGYFITCDLPVILGVNDIKLARKLIKGGTVHSKFERMIVLYMDLTASFDFWKEYDTYKVGTVANSCSTMHTISKHPLTIENFSTADLTDKDIEFMKKNIEYYNSIVNNPNITKLEKTRRLSKLNMLAFEQKRTIELDYCTIASIMKWRHNHTLKEWRDLCVFFRKLPYFEILYGESEIDIGKDLEEANASTN